MYEKRGKKFISYQQKVFTLHLAKHFFEQMKECIKVVQSFCRNFPPSFIAKGRKIYTINNQFKRAKLKKKRKQFFVRNWTLKPFKI